MKWISNTSKTKIFHYRWHTWFAWFPVVVRHFGDGSKLWAWLKYIERRKCVPPTFAATGIEYEYRLKEKK